MSHITTERKQEIFKQFGGKETNTGDTKAQIALFTERINHITAHLKNNRKDYSSTQALIRMVGKRRSLLNYLAKKDLDGYRSLIQELKLRK